MFLIEITHKVITYKYLRSVPENAFLERTFKLTLFDKSLKQII